MEQRYFSLAPTSAGIGAEISGLDLSADMPPEVWTELHQAFLDYNVLFFRKQSLTPAQLVDFARRFGPIGHYPFGEPIAAHPDVIAVIKEAHQTSNFGGIWHTDTAYLERPSLGSVLYSRQVPALGGDTLWANQYAAYEALSDGMKELLEGLKAVHSAGKNKAELRLDHLAKGAETARDAARMDVQKFAHPVVRRHPETGRKALYLSAAHTICFEDMTEAESAPLLNYLFEHAIRPEFCCRFQWTPDTVAVWDNRCSLHYPLNDYHGSRRELHRVTIEGERPQ